MPDSIFPHGEPPAAALSPTDREMFDILTTGKSPCGHFGAYAVTSDGGKLVTCLQCRAEAAEAELVDVYQLAKEHWCAQCFGFTGAPESMLRAAHETARDGFDQICKKLGPTVHPILKAEYDAAVKESAVLSPSPDEEMVPHAFSSRTRYEPGDDRDIWCKVCEYHRDHEIHTSSVVVPTLPERSRDLAEQIVLFLRSDETDGGTNLTTEEAVDRIVDVYFALSPSEEPK